MTTGLSPITLSAAGPMMAAALGLSWENSRDEAVEKVNEFRNLLFNLYPEEELFTNVFHCICVSQFSEGCSTKCSTGNTFHGFTVPADVAGVEAIFDAGVSLPVRSRWRETRTGMPQNCGARIDALEMSQQFPTERDPDGIVSLKVFATDRRDAGKTVFLEVIDADWNEVTLAFELLADGWAAHEAVHVREIRAVSLPAGRKGAVKLAQTDGRELSIYFPWEHVPAYRRFKVPARCASRSVLLQGNKNFRPLSWDNEIVEVGDTLVIKHAGKYFHHGDNTTDQKELKTAEYHLTKMKEQLDGLIARHRGRAVMDGTPARGRPITASTRLPGYGR